MWTFPYFKAQLFWIQVLRKLQLALGSAWAVEQIMHKFDRYWYNCTLRFCAPTELQEAVDFKIWVGSRYKAPTSYCSHIRPPFLLLGCWWMQSVSLQVPVRTGTRTGWRGCAPNAARVSVYGYVLFALSVRQSNFKLWQVLLFMPRPSLLFEIFPYRYQKSAYAPLCKEFGVYFLFVLLIHVTQLCCRSVLRRFYVHSRYTYVGSSVVRCINGAMHEQQVIFI